ncbi:regulator of microtubule dynamics protein 3-like [Leucoraja erinacea]|uniref:regulator of microtubule dynamics protein 3-like n=1 Tax=Leucoraja erinaceus TaxID=7782 RepID=UPI0024585795|nr:regulator of microtubule dynamics protein 3-like [Leucoraja erinacea]
MFSKEGFKAAALLAGAGVASGALGIYYLWRHHKGPLLLDALGQQELVWATAKSEELFLLEDQEAPSGVSEEQAEIRWHLDSIQTCLNGLKDEVASLRGCIQGIVEKQVSLKKYKTARRKKRRYESKRDSDDSAESVSIYFTANAGKPSDSESEAGQIEIPAGMDCSMLAFTAASFTDDRAGPEMDSSLLQFQQEIGFTTPSNETEIEKDEEEVSDLVQVLNFSPPTEPEADSSIQSLKSPIDEESEMNSLLQQVDTLHDGTKEEQEQGFNILLDNKNKYGKRKEFCWRMIRAYSDMFQLTEDKETQKCYALAGRDEGNASLKDHADSIECQIWLAIVSGYLDEHEAEDRSEGNDEVKEIEDEAGVLIELTNSLDNIKIPDVVPLDDAPETAEVTDKVEEQGVQSRHASNILVEVINSCDTAFLQHSASSIADSSEIVDIHDRNIQQDMKALDEANLMVEFIDGYHITYRSECNLLAPDVAKSVAATDSDNDQDEPDEVKDAKY